VGPVLCLITPPASAAGDTDDALVARVAAAARAGVQLIQIRRPDDGVRPLLRLVRSCLDAVASTTTRVLVNDRLDVALAAGAHGVHLRGDAPPARRLRALTPPGFLLGRSVHAVDEAVHVAEQGGLDYLLLGTIFSTPSKPGAAAVGTGVLAAAVARVALPVLAVGGVTLARLVEVRRAGAAGIAAIGLFDVPPDGMARVVEAARVWGAREA
jgi:thiamine-phosphate diphosphorylase